MVKRNNKALIFTLILLLLYPTLGNAQYISANESNEIKNIEIDGKSDNGHPVSNAIDGDKTTYWQSPPNNSMEDHSRHVDMDLNGLYQLNEIEISNRAGSYYHYEIYVSKDGLQYDKKIDKNNNEVSNGTDVYPLDAEARYVRINVSFNSASQQVNLSDVKLYGELIDNSEYTIPEIEVEDFEDTHYAEEFKRFNDNPAYAEEKTIATLKGLVSRVLGEAYVDHFIFEVENKLEDDYFELSDRNNKVLIRANNGGSLASGFNYYLKSYAKLYYNPLFESNVEVNGELPLVEEHIVKETPYDYRYALNFVTFSYTMSFWGFEEYQAFIDWAAMNGYNLVLDILGQEEVLRQTLKKYGYTDKEIKDYITGPAYFGWFYMQNMYSFGGPLPDNWFAERTELSREIHDLMQVYNIKPVMQAFAGQVPLDFAEKNPKSIAVNPGGWPGFQRPYLIKTYLTDQDKANGYEDYFEKVSKDFYETQERLFGNYTDYYAVDPFHEGGNIHGTGMDIESVYAAVQEHMLEANEDSIWVMQQWQWNITSNKLAKLPNEKQVLALDLQSDLNSQVDPMEEHGVPWVWNMLHNFGGRMGLDGELKTIANKISVDHDKYENMVGIGITPEAINNSPIVYDLISDMIWTQDPVNYRTWTEDYIESKYGVKSDNLEKAWDILLDTAYADKGKYYQGASESVINAKPSLNINSASTWGHSEVMYDKETLEQVIPLFISEYDKLKDNPAFVYDFVDVTKQILANSAQEYHKLMSEAYTNKNIEQFESISNTFLEIIRLQDQVLSTSEPFLLGTWIDQSRNMLESMDDWTADLFEFNARALITTWAAEKNANGGGLDDYSNRQWAGLTEDYYLPRWEKWIASHLTALKENNQPKSINWFMNGWEWVNEKKDKTSFATDATDLDLSELAQTAYDVYSVTQLNNNLSDRKNTQEINVILGKQGIADVDTAVGYDLSALTDDSNESGWQAAPGSESASITYEFENIEEITTGWITLQQIANTFPMSYSIDIHDGTKWIEDKIVSDAGLVSKNEFDINASALKVRFNFQSTDGNDLEEIKELAIFVKQNNLDNYVNIAKDATISTSASDGGKGPENLVDGNDETLWVSANGSVPAHVSLDYDEAEYVDYIVLKFEKNTPNRSFAFKVTGTDANDNEIVLFERGSDQLDENHQIINRIGVQQNVKNIAVEITDAKVPSDGGAAWPLIAELEVWQEREQSIEAINISKILTASSTVPHQSGREPANVIDGNFDSLWIADNGKVPSDVILTLPEAKVVSDMNLHFEKANSPFQIVVTANKGNADEFVILDKSANNTGLEKTYELSVNKLVETITVDFVGYSDSNASAWPAISEIEVFEKPENIAPEANTDKLNELVDGDITTGIVFEQGTHVLDFNFDKAYDVMATELVANEMPNEVVQYKIEVLKDGKYVEVGKQTDFQSVKSTYGHSFKSILTDQVRVTLEVNEEVELREFRIYKESFNALLVSALDKVAQNIDIGEYAGQFKQTAYESLQSRLDEERELLNNDLNSEEVASSLDRIYQAMIDFYKEGFIEIDRDYLRAYYVNSLRLIDALTNSALENQADVFETYLEEVSEVLYGKKVTQEEIDNILEVLLGKHKTFLGLLDVKEQIDLLITVIEKQLETKIGDMEDMVSQEGYDTLNGALLTAKETIAQELELTGLLETLTEASINLDKAIVVVDKSRIQEKYDLLNGLEGDYSGSSYQSLQDALSAVAEVLANKVSKAVAEEAFENLLEAELNLVILDRSNLTEEISKAESYDLDQYEDGGVNNLQSILKEAKNVVQSNRIEQSIIDEIVSSLQAALKGLVLMPEIPKPDPEIPDPETPKPDPEIPDPETPKPDPEIPDPETPKSDPKTPKLETTEPGDSIIELKDEDGINEEQGENELPKTNSNIFNYLLVGSFIILLGVFLFIRNRLKKQAV